MPKQTEITCEINKYPRQVRLDTTTQCNARCVSCHRFNTKRKGEMPVELMMKILRDVGSWAEPLVEIVPVNYGEFFMRKDWLWILEMIERHLPNTQIVIPTNGSLLDPEAAKQLCSIQNLFLINFSINALFEETYEAFTGLPYKVTAQIENAIKTIKAERPDVYLRASMVFDPMYQTDYERDCFNKYWSEIAETCILPAASASRGKSVMKPVLTPCRSLFNDIVVGFDGKLSSCCWDSNFSLDLGYYSGNLLNDWNGEKLTALRTAHNEHRRDGYELCRQCTFS